MADMQFSIGKALSTGWEIFKKEWTTLLGAGAVAFVAYMIPSVLSSALAKDAPGLSALFNLVAFAVSIVLQVGVMVIALKLVDGKRAEIADLWSHTNLLPAFIGTAIIYALMVLGGSILLILPGIYIAARYQLYGYVVIDQKLGVMDSIKAAGAIGKTQWFNLLGFSIVSGIIAFIASLPMGLGLILALPVLLIASASVYRQLVPQHGEAPAAAPAPATETV